MITQIETSFELPVPFSLFAKKTNSRIHNIKTENNEPRLEKNKKNTRSLNRLCKLTSRFGRNTFSYKIFRTPIILSISILNFIQVSRDISNTVL